LSRAAIIEKYLMPQNYFTPFTDVFKSDVYIILIFSQNSFDHMVPFPNLEDNSAVN